jgi:pimeloyl-ACP methyl ester carboxylesterase
VAMTQPTTRTLEAPGATLTYDVRPGSGDDIPLFLIGSPMGAAGFGSLASHLPDRTIITYDPRGAERSTKADPSTESNPTSTPMTCIGSSRRSGDRWISSRAAVVR